MTNNMTKKILNMFFEDVATLLVIIPVGFIICYFIVMQEYALKWFWTVLIALALWYVLISTTKRFKLWMLSRKDLKNNKITKKEIVIEELKHEHSSHNVHHTTHNFLEDLITDVLLGWTENVLKTSGGEDRYTLTDTENNTYHLMNFYKRKMRKKDIKGEFYYSELKGRVLEIEYLEQSKVILSIKMSKNDKDSKLVGGFAEVFGGYMI